MHTTLAALAVVTVGYILAHFVFDKLRTRLGYAGGAEYLLLGFLLGPRVSGFLSEEAVRDLTPLVSLALGWLGLSLGMYFRLPTLALVESSYLGIAFAEALGTFVVALGVLFALFHYFAGFPLETTLVAASTLAAIATLSSPAAIDAFSGNRERAAHPIFPVLQLTARIDGLVGVVGFGVALAIFHQGDVAPGVRPPTATEWAVINIAVGVASGVLFHLFLGPRDQIAEDDGESRLFVALAAAIVIASGAAYYLNLSPIYTNLILGFILANTGKAHTAARELLAGTERPVYLALLIFAGAAWSSAEVDLLYLAPAFVGLRLVARLIGGRVAGTLAAPAVLRSPSMGRALLAQGGIGVAIALNYGQVYPAQHADVVLTAAILSVLLFEVAAAAETSGFLAPPKEKPEPEGETAQEPARGPDAALDEVTAS